MVEYAFETGDKIMEREELLKDYLVSRVISMGKSVDGYSKIFYKTNEDLVDAYLDVDFDNKKVLSVLASGDHVLTSDFLDAKRTDSFDMNRLPLYYYYLRIWSIEYMNELYPKVLDGNSWLRELLEYVEPRNEQENNAFKFFRQNLSVNTEISNLFYDVDAQPIGSTLFSKPEELIDIINPELSFRLINLFDNNAMENNYDIILISNILELTKRDPNKIKAVRENLSKLLKQGGVVICSSIIHRTSKEKEAERRIFDSCFDFEPKEKGYLYIKKNA